MKNLRSSQWKTVVKISQSSAGAPALAHVVCFTRKQRTLFTNITKKQNPNLIHNDWTSQTADKSVHKSQAIHSKCSAYYFDICHAVQFISNLFYPPFLSHVLIIQWAIIMFEWFVVPNIRLINVIDSYFILLQRFGVFHLICRYQQCANGWITMINTANVPSKLQDD